MKKTISLATLAGVVLVLAFAFNLSPLDNQAKAQETTPFPSREKVISVTGTATTSVDPDLLVIQFGVETQEKTAKASLESNSQMMSNVVNAIKGVGITEDELSTSRLNISPIYDYYNEPSGKSTQELIGYRVSNILMVETEQLDKAADIIDGAVQVGANRIDSVYFTLSPQKQLEIKDGLLEGAILNAKSKAEKALSPLNHKIIGVKAVSLSEFGMPPPIPYPQYGFDMAGAAVMKASTPVFSSEQDVTTTASVIFLIGSN
jgi:uncharacterized protein